MELLDKDSRIFEVVELHEVAEDVHVIRVVDLDVEEIMLIRSHGHSPLCRMDLL
jgi:hypothetical protein